MPMAATRVRSSRGYCMPRSSLNADPAAALDAALDPVFLHKLDRLRLTVHDSASPHPGNTLMRHGSQAQGMELMDHRQYVPGDDPRSVDWSAYGRLGALWVKRFRSEREAPLQILIDTSASMGVPAADGKLALAAGLAASLAYIGLRQQDPVQLVALGAGNRMVEISPLFRHIGRFAELRAFLGRLRADGAVPLHDAVRAYRRTMRPAALVILISDFLLPLPACEEALGMLGGPLQAVAALRVIGPHERDPNHLPPRVVLHDVEGGSERLVAITSEHRQRYVRALETHLDHLASWCAHRRQAFVTVDSDRGLEHCMFDQLPRSGVVH
jgi:uncharacterized protein (DUF58 family)